jgi:hypothetical protein
MAPDEPNPQYRILLGLLEANTATNIMAATLHLIPKEPSTKLKHLLILVRPIPSLALPMGLMQYCMEHSMGLPGKTATRLMRIAMDAGMPWIRQQVRWMDLHDKSGVIYWGELDSIVEDAAKWQTNLLLSVVAAPTWTTDNGLHGMPNRAHYATFNYFMSQMANRYKGRVKAYEIWNEENLATENGGTVSSVNDYMDMLVGASQAVKAADPQGADCIRLTRLHRRPIGNGGK